MHTVSLHIDCRIRSRWAEVLARAAANTPTLIDDRNLRQRRILLLHHLDGAIGAMLSAIAATITLGYRYTVLINPNGMTDLSGRFLLQRNGLNCPRRTYFRASIALDTTIAALVTHRRLHQLGDIG